MLAVIVDSNVILDLLMPDSSWRDWSVRALAAATERSRLVINPIIYAEVSVAYHSVEVLEAVLPAAFDREGIPYEAAFLAGKVFRDYRRRGGTKTAPLPDFFIGAHAAVSGYQLLTRDPSRYRFYYPPVKLIAPD